MAQVGGDPDLLNAFIKALNDFISSADGQRGYITNAYNAFDYTYAGIHKGSFEGDVQRLSAALEQAYELANGLVGPLGNLYQDLTAADQINYQ